MYCQEKISIIIPVFNGQKFIQDNINSLLTQTYSEFEAIYVDDGSTDSSVQLLIRECTYDQRFKWFSKPNGGISSTIKFGLEKASSNYIVLLDQDDIAMPNRLELTAQAFKRGAELIMGDYEIVDETLCSTGTIIKIPNSILGDKFLLEQMKRSYILGSAMAFKNKHDFSFLESSGGATDYDITLKMLLNSYRFEYIPEILIKYRVHQNNTSANYSNQKRDVSNVISQYKPVQLTQLLNNIGFKEGDIALSLGILYLFQEKLAIAEQFLSNASLTLDLNDWNNYEEYYFYLGVLKFSLNDISSAFNIFKMLVKKSENPSILNNYGYFLIRKGNIEEASEYFVRSLKRHRDYLDAKLNLNQCNEANSDTNFYRFTKRLLRENLTHKSIIV
ncbi:glycosyltransferase [Robertmurraya sp. GLU-23]